VYRWPSLNGFDVIYADRRRAGILVIGGLVSALLGVILKFQPYPEPEHISSTVTRLIIAAVFILFGIIALIRPPITVYVSSTTIIFVLCSYFTVSQQLEMLDLKNSKMVKEGAGSKSLFVHQAVRMWGC
jgi:hypothetical protein